MVVSEVGWEEGEKVEDKGKKVEDEAKESKGIGV